MSNELYCEKRVVTEEEHQYWMDRTIPFPGVDKKYQARYRMCNRFVTDCDTDGLVNKDHIGEGQFITYYPLSRILSWGGWNYKAHASYTNPNIEILGNGKSKSKSKLAKELSYFKSDSSIILDHFDENSSWHWDWTEAPYSERTKFDTIYDPITKKSTYSKMIQEETA